MKWLISRVSVQTVGVILFLAGLIVACVGFLNRHYNLPLIKPFEYFMADFYANISVDIIGIAITILIIDQMYERSKTKETRRQLIRQMGTMDSGFALLAVDELSAHGWLQDGSLREGSFYQANLPGAHLVSADLEQTMFTRANLSNADLKWANLRKAKLNSALLDNSQLIGTDLSQSRLTQTNLGEAYLIDANLQEADLQMAVLTRACLWGTNLRGARVTDEQLQKAIMLNGTIMPDGTMYDGRFRLKGDVLLAKQKYAVDDLAKAQEFLPGSVRENETHARQFLRWKWVSEKLLRD